MRTLVLSPLVSLALMLPARPVALAQGPQQIVLVVRQAGKETGRETFTRRDGRGGGAAGSTIVAAARYPASNPTLQLAATLERTEELALAKFQMEVEGPTGTTVILAAGSGARLIVRTVAKGSEAGRELPGGPDVVLLDDAVFSLYAQVADLATPAGRPLTAVFPRTSRRVSFTARREGADGGNRRVTLSGDLSGTLLTDAQGRVIRLELPASQIVVTREEQ